MTVSKSSLTFRRQLGKGGFGVVHEVDTPARLVAERTCAYKELSKASPADLDNIRLLVDFRKSLPDSERATLDSIATWPLELVEDRGQAVGYLMRLIPQRFMEDAITQTSGTTTAMRSLDWLAKPEHARRSGAKLVIDADDLIMRLAFCAQLARAVHFLHRHGIVYGDLSQTNAVHSDSPAEVMLIDLDPVRIESSSPPIPQAHSPSMRPPECAKGQKHQDVYTDRFKLAILFYNILGAKAQVDAQLSGLTGRIDNAGISLFAAALGSDKAARPSADTWYRYFHGQVMALSQPPQVASFTVTPAHAFRGQDVTVEWNVTGHRTLALKAPWGQPKVLNISGQGSEVISLQSSGQFHLIASNDHGTIDVASDLVHSYDAPVIQFVEIPEFGDLDPCAVGIDTVELSKRVGLGSEFSWVGGMLSTASAAEESSLGSLLAPSDLDASTVMDTSGLMRLVADSMDSAEVLVRTGAPRRRTLRERVAEIPNRARAAMSRQFPG